MRGTRLRVARWRRPVLRALVSSAPGLVLGYLGMLWFGRDKPVNVLFLLPLTVTLPLALSVLFFFETPSVSWLRCPIGPRAGRRGSEPPPVVATAPEVPAPLVVAAPSGSGFFVGREEMLEQMGSALAEAVAAGRVGVVNLSGPPGVGKTTLAEQFTLLAQENYAGGVLRATLRGTEGALSRQSRESPESGPPDPEDPTELQAVLLGQMPQRPGGAESPDQLPTRAEDREALYRRLVDEGEFLVVLDEVDGIEQVRDLIPADSASAVVLVSRVAIEGAPITRNLPVPGLDPEDAVALLGRIVDAARVREETEAAHEIARLCGYMPLALTVAGSLLALRPYWSLESFAERLRDARLRLGELQVGDVEVRKSLSLSYDDLSEREQLAFRRLGLWEPDTFAPWVLSPLLDDVSIEEATRIAESLARASLLERVSREPVRYAMHELVKCYAKEKLDEDPSYLHVGAVERLASAYLVLAARVVETCLPSRGGNLELFGRLPSGLPVEEHFAAVVGDAPTHWLAAESHALVAAFELAKRTGLKRLCWQVALTVLPFFELMRSAWGRWEMPPVTAMLVGDKERVERGAELIREGAAIHQIQGALLMGSDRFEEAEDEYRAAAALYTAVGDGIGVAESVRGLGEVLRMLGRYTEAVEALKEAAAGSQAVGDRLGRARALLDLGNCHRIVHLDEVSNTELEQALLLFSAVGDEFERARTLRALGNLYRQRRELEIAQRFLTEALTVFQSFEARPGDSYWVACTRYSLGKLLRDQGRLREAGDEFDRARLAFGSGPGSRLWKARILRQLAQARSADGQWAEAEELAVKALTQFEELGVDFWVAHARHTLGRILAHTPSRLVEAREHLTVAKELYEKVGNSWCAADAASHLAAIYPAEHAGDAIRLMRAAVGTFGQFDDRRRQLEALKALERLETLDSDARAASLRRRLLARAAPAGPKSPDANRIAS